MASRKTIRKKSPVKPANPRKPSPIVPEQPVGIPASPYLLSEEAALYLRFDSPQLFREWAWKYSVPHLKRGRRLLFDRAVLDAYLRGEDWTRRRALDQAS